MPACMATPWACATTSVSDRNQFRAAVTNARPYSAASERNREPILAVLRCAFAGRRRVLEIGSGTGQHAVHFAAALPELVWQSSDRAENLEGIRAWLDQAGLPNTPAPLSFDVRDAQWPAGGFDAVFTANTLHIMAPEEVEILFRRLPEVLAAEARVAIYGPFNYGGRHTSPSNAQFDASLRAGDPRRGIRDIEWITQLAQAAGLSLIEDCEMPANNRLLLWATVSASVR